MAAKHAAMEDLKRIKQLAGIELNEEEASVTKIAVGLSFDESFHMLEKNYTNLKV